MPDNKRELTSDEENENNKRQKLDSNDDNPDVGINKLPNEILQKIGGFFDKKDRGNFALTNKRFKEVSDNLDERELNIVLPKLGFAGMKDKKPITIPESRIAYKHLEDIQEHCINYLDSFYTLGAHCLTPNQFEGPGTYSFFYPMMKMLESLHSRKNTHLFKINWAEVFDNAITTHVAREHHSNYDLNTVLDNLNDLSEEEEIKYFYSSLMQGNNEAGYSLLHLVAYSFEDPDCKDVLERLITKYKANFYLEGISLQGEPTSKNTVLHFLNKNNSTESISYIQSLIQQEQEQLNVNNQP